MATPTLLQIDDRNPLVFYSPNSSWTRGGNIADFDGTSTFTSTIRASATLTFTGTGISVWGTIQLLSPNMSTYVLSSYSIDGGPSTTFNATEKVAYQFQQKLFQSATLNDSAPHTIVVTLDNDASFFIDYFLVIPAGATSTSASSSNPSTVTGPMTVFSAVSSTTASTGAQSPSSRVPLGPAVGGTLSGLALLIVAILAVWLCCKRRKENKKNDSQMSPVPFITPSSHQPIPMQQYQPYEGSDAVSEYQPYSQHPSTSRLLTSTSGVILPSSKAAQLSNPSRRRDSLHSRPLSDSPEPPGYAE